MRSAQIGVALTLSIAASSLFATSANAFDFELKVEPGVAIPLTSPQSGYFKVGGAGTIKALFGLGRYLDIGPTVSLLGLPAETGAPSTDPGIAWALGGGLRLKRPHDRLTFAGVSPWLDGDLLYVRTGPLNRFGFALGAGVSFPVGEARHFWLGPFVRYFQIVQSERIGFDNSDAKILIAGISFEVGTKPKMPAPAVVVVPVAADCPPAVVVARAADRDNDGVPDEDDVCPDVAGPADNHGCPVYQKIVVRADKIELKEHIQFAWDQSVIEAVSFPLLDDVVKALLDNKSFHVRVEGHTDSTGHDAHNQPLSERRAQAVLDYLVRHGVPAERLHSAGFSSSVPLETNRTVAGREANRRVEFVVELVILKNPKDGSTK